MSPPQTEESSPVLKLVTLIREITGNVIPPARMAFLEEVAERRAQARRLGGVEAYVRALAARELPDEWESLIPLVTIKESYFFRAPQQFDVIRQRILPALVKARSASRQLRIWSAACARGEEPATLAMLLADEPALAGWSWTIVATDLDEEALAGARLGLYGERAVSQVPPDFLARWFSRRGKLYELDAGLRSRIVYQSLNLAHAPFVLPYDELDLVLMRNVLIYFRRPLQRWVISQVARLLTPEGYLFLGASETLWQIQDALESVDLGPCFAYRHRRALPAAEESAEAPVKRPERPRMIRPAPLPASSPAPQPPQPAPPRPAQSRP
ncbi:MAG: CheR family methyltransferase, partial [Thermoanaerobaculia bacterium]